jgi:hypothetical protein
MTRPLPDQPEYFICLIEAYPCNTKDELLAREQHYIDIHTDVCVNKHKAFYDGNLQDYNKEYYQQNQNKIRQQSAKWYAEHQKEAKKRDAKYREANREKTRQRQKQRRDCECGGKYTLSNQAVHTKSQRHKAHVNIRNDLIRKLNALFGEEDWSKATFEEMHEILQQEHFHP